MSYRWNAAERGVRDADSRRRSRKWQVIQPAADWKSMPWTAGKDAFKVATDLLLRQRAILDANGRPVNP